MTRLQEICVEETVIRTGCWIVQRTILVNTLVYFDLCSSGWLYLVCMSSKDYETNWKAWKTPTHSWLHAFHTCDSTAGSKKIPFSKPVCRSTVPVDQTTVLENFRKYYENPIKKVSQYHCSGTRQSNWCQSFYQSAAYACAVGGDFGYCYQSDCVSFDTSQTIGSYLWYRKLINKHSAMIRDQKWPGVIDL